MSTRFIFVDVEAAGKSPYRGVMTEFGAVEYETEAPFHGVLWEASPDPANPAVPLVKPDAKHYDEEQVLRMFDLWLESWGDRVVFVSDNPAYDYQWINFYFDKHRIENRFGHSARRIGDFFAGLKGNWRHTSDWKKYRVTTHDHNPVNDALGNVEAVKALVAKYDVKGLQASEKLPAKVS